MKNSQNFKNVFKVLSLVFIFIPFISSAQKSKSMVHFNTPQTYIGYSKSVEVDLQNSKMIIISGQVAIDKNGKLIGEGSMEKQTEQFFTNLKELVEQHGGTMKDIVKLGYFVKDLERIDEVRLVRDKFINQEHPPASTLVEIKNLFRPELLIEIEATAIIPKL